MPAQFLAWLMTTFAFVMPLIFGQPTTAPETRVAPPYALEDRYGVWPTEAFETDTAPLWLPTSLLRPAYFMRGLLNEGSTNHGIVALYKGKIVYEWYADGWDKDKPHDMFSATKSITSALVGIAIEDGFIDSVDDTFVKYYPDADIEIDAELKQQITIKQMLTMTSGLGGDNDDVYAGIRPLITSEEDMKAIDERFEKDDAKTTFELCSMVVKPGERWNYSTLSTGLLLGLVARVIDRPLEDYVTEKLFGPMGITNYKWYTRADGVYVGGTALLMTPRDMAKFGYLYLNWGRWDGQQLVPADWVAQSIPASKAFKAYGYQFWNKPYTPFLGAYEANGYANQLIGIFPGQDLVIARTGTASVNYNFSLAF